MSTRAIQNSIWTPRVESCKFYSWTPTGNPAMLAEATVVFPMPEQPPRRCTFLQWLDVDLRQRPGSNPAEMVLFCVNISECDTPHLENDYWGPEVRVNCPPDERPEAYEALELQAALLRHIGQTMLGQDIATQEIMVIESP